MSTGELCVVCGEEAKFVITGIWAPVCSKLCEGAVRRSREKYLKRRKIT